ncbi:MAG: metalloregulator ArsR/SmtB family transcription factor [Candidatus Obscuribacterales bacterium]|nr:metalloregulator ArsR/SmtB family transcription factor [Candidatus Obscuribacterales bacterium]
MKDAKLDLTEFKDTCCPVQVMLPDEVPLTDKEANDLEDLFKVLANDTRLKLLHTLARVEEMCVCDIAQSLGMNVQAISNQLQRLSDRGIVATKRSGNMIYYRVVDRCLIDILKKAQCLLNDAEKNK